MCMAKLCCWITGFGKPCEIEDTDTWYVHVLDCEGKVVEWCGKKYRDLEARCGHVELELPPGCYAVFASHTAGLEGNDFGNRLTHVQVVRVNCGDEVCVTLFSPSMWFCGTWFEYAVRTQLPRLERANVDRRTAVAAVQAVRALLDKIPAEPFTANMREAFQQEDREAYP